MSAELQPPGSDRLRSLVHAGLRYLDARAQLAQIEAHEAGLYVRRALVLAALLAAGLAGAWLLMVPAVVVLIAEKLGMPWTHVALGSGGLHLILAIIVLRRLWSLLGRTRLFEESINQFHHDRAWLAGTQER
jgi:uncharacterized membrane protein YqjE